MTVVSIAVPEEILRKLEKVKEDEGYASRSEIFRESIRDYLNEYRLRKNREGSVSGVISIMYEVEDDWCSEKIHEIHHRNDDLVYGALHLHFDKGNCFDIWIIEGKGEEVTALIEKLKSIRGTKHIGEDLISI